MQRIFLMLAFLMSAFGVVSVAQAEQLSGVVLDSSGAPVAGARVLSPDSAPATQATSGADGNFVLENLKPEFVAIIALHPEKGWSSTRQISSGSDVSLKLTPFSPPFTQNRARAEKILLEMRDWAAGDEYLSLASLWAMLAPYDLERAVELGRTADGTLPDNFVFMTIAALGRENPAKATEWGATLLDEMKDDEWRAMATATLGKAVADINPTLANELFESAHGFHTEFNFHRDDLFQLAVKLKRPEMRLLVHEALEKARKDDVEEAGESDLKSYVNQIGVIATLAAVDIAEAERAVSLIDAEARSEAQARVIVALVRRGGPEELAKARQLLELLASAKEPQARKFYSSSALRVLPVLGKTDPEAALALARRVTEKDSKPEALAAAAYFQEDAASGVLLREAADAALQHSSPVGQLANLALVAAPKFPDLASELTTQALQLWGRAKPEERDAYWRNGAAGSLLQAVAQTDILTARGLLEIEWARVYPTAAKGENIWLLSGMTREMAQLDFERALELARKVPANEGGYLLSRFGAQRALARMLLIGPEKWNSSLGYSWNQKLLGG